MREDVVELVSRSSEETQDFGKRLGGLLRAGDVLGLVGELGSGKTTLIQGLAKGLGLDASSVRSPTFIVLREYPGIVPLIHVDGYRLEGAPAAVWLDVDWIFSPKKVTVIEWANQIADVLPEDYLEVQLAHRSTNQRSIRLRPHGPRSEQIVRAISESSVERGA